MELIRLASFKLPENGITAIIFLEHIGDIIACEPVIGYAKKTWPDQPVAWVILAQYVGLLEGHPALDYLLIAGSLAQANDWASSLPDNCRAINLHFHQRPCPTTGIMVTNSNDPAIDRHNYYDQDGLLTINCKIAGITPLTEAPRFYIKEQTSLTLPASPYVVFHCLSNDVNRCWEIEKWKKLFDYFAARKINVAEVGQNSIINSASPYYYDLSGVLSLQQIALLIKNSFFFIGIESGFAHMANALNKDGLVIMGAYQKWYNYMPYTGLYASGHIVRHPFFPTRYLPVKKVTDHYEEFFKKPIGSKIKTDDEEKAKIFPNPLQKLILKVYRPLAKHDPELEYDLFKRAPRFYFMIAEKDKFRKKVIRAILKMVGEVPEQIDY